MLTPWTDKIIGKFFSLINISADFADIAFLFLFFRLRLYVGKIIFICYIIYKSR